MHGVTDKGTDRQTDNMIMPIAQYDRLNNIVCLA